MVRWGLGLRNIANSESRGGKERRASGVTPRQRGAEEFWVWSGKEGGLKIGQRKGREKERCND